MDLACSACGVSLAGGSFFCHRCGMRVSEAEGPPSPDPRHAAPASYTPAHLAERILTARSALEGERKRVTVMFCDIVDSTPLAVSLGEERMFALLGRFFGLVLEIVHGYNGTVNQFLGDGVMALFGAPLALEHHEQHALLAGLSIRDRLQEALDPTSHAAGSRLAIRFGINTGHVVIGKIGDNLRMDYTAVGDTTHVAARLQALAAPDELVLSEVSFDAVRAIVRSRSLGSIPIKGRKDAVVAYSVQGLRAGHGGLRPLQGRSLSQFFGREAELATLVGAVDECARAHRGSVLCVRGEPGMGKSRLLRELRLCIGAQARIVEGACFSYGVHVPYLPVVAILRAAGRIRRGDGAEAVRGKLRALVERLALDEATALPCLLHLFGLEALGTSQATAQAAEALHARIADVLVQLSLRAAARRPLVLAIEDLHWADAGTMHFISRLAEQVGGAAILLLVTCRMEHGLAWLKGPHVRGVMLHPLSEPGALAITQAVLRRHGVDAARAREVVARAGGNPLFMEELARAVGEIPDADQAIPDTLQGVLSARLDGLPDMCKRVLQVASVIGRAFHLPLLEAAWLDDGDLAAALEQLVQGEFLTATPVEGAPEFAFKHALVRDTAYNSLLSGRRQACHRLVAEALEQGHGGRDDDVLELLAQHFEQADVDVKAVDYALRAFDKAAKLWSNDAAVAFSNAALHRLEARTDDDANRRRIIDLVLQQAEVRVALGQLTAQLDALARIEALVSQVGDVYSRAKWHYWMGFLSSLVDRPNEIALRHSTQASRIALEAGLEDLHAAADCSLAQIYLMAGDLALSMEIGERALAVFERRKDGWWCCRTLAQLGPACNAMGDSQRSLAYGERSLAHGLALNDLRLKVSALLRLASAHIQRGAWQEGLVLCERARALSPVARDTAALQAVHGYGAMKNGEVERGADMLRRALAWYHDARQRYAHVQASLWLAEGWLLAREFAQALAIVNTTLDVARDAGFRYQLGVAHRLLGECLLPSSVHGAVQAFRRADALLQAVGAVVEVIKCRQSLASVGFPLEGDTGRQLVPPRSDGWTSEAGGDGARTLGPGS